DAVAQGATDRTARLSSQQIYDALPWKEPGAMRWPEPQDHQEMKAHEHGERRDMRRDPEERRRSADRDDLQDAVEDDHGGLEPVEEHDRAEIPAERQDADDRDRVGDDDRHHRGEPMGVGQGGHEKSVAARRGYSGSLSILNFASGAPPRAGRTMDTD